jgi:hypothetical protein
MSENGARVERYIAIMGESAWHRDRGRCPACGAFFDDAGCRLGEIRGFTIPPGDRHPLLRAWTEHVGRVVEVFCTGTPTGPVSPCPCCATHPGRACPGASGEAGR